MAWKPGPNAPLGVANGLPGTADVVTVVPIGTVREFYEDTQGPCELIYLPGVASLAAGDIVSYDLTPGAQATTRHVNNSKNNSGFAVAIALAAVPAGSYGWFQIGGVSVVNATAASAAGSMFATATAGSVNSAADAGDQILNARLLTALGTPAAGKQYAHVNRPCIQSQIT